MAYTTSKNMLTLIFRDVREQERVRVVELGGLVVVTDDNAAEMDLVSKSAVPRYVQQNYQRDAALSADAQSEVRDTLRLYFRLPDGDKGHFDIVDPKDTLFLSTTGAGANIPVDKSTMDAADPVGNPGSPAEELDALGNIIDSILSGEYLISDGEQPEAYLGGERVTWR